MTSDRNSILWIPLAIGVSAVILGLALAKFWAGLPDWVSIAGVIVALALVAIAVYLAYQRTPTARPSGGRGGQAFASGEDTEATGGRGGDAGKGDGGDGGRATAKGKGSVARAGDGGKG